MRDSWNAWGETPEPTPAPRDGTLSLLWLKMRRLAGTRPSTPTDDMEGQVRYERDGDVNGKVYVARHLTGSTYEWSGVPLLGDPGADRLVFWDDGAGEVTYLTAGAGLLISGTTITATALDSGHFNPPGPQVVDAAQVTVLASGNSGARYLGMTPFDVTSVSIRVNVTTAVATITWAEMALASGASATSGNLTLLGSATDVSGTFNSTGNKTVTFTVNIPAGTFVYAVFGSAATTPFQLRATIADELGTGVTRTASSTRPSTMAAPTAFSTSTALTAAAWIVVRWS